METNAALKKLRDDTIQLDLRVKSLIKDILDCDSSHEDLNQLIASVAQTMRSHKTSIDNFSKLSKELSNPSVKKSLEAEIDGFKSQMEVNAISLRKAIASSQKLLSSKTREQLFQTNAESSDGLRKRSSAVNREILVNKSTEITDNLKSVSRLLATQVTQSDHTLQSLISSSATVTETQEEFKSMRNLINQSRKLLTKYGRREVTDKVLIVLALMFFFGCVFYVISKRLFGWRYS